MKVMISNRSIIPTHICERPLFTSALDLETSPWGPAFELLEGKMSSPSDRWTDQSPDREEVGCD
jgi:hypothetical protein